MTFLLPLGLLSLLLLPVVALLHLIQRRRERLRVPSLQIWRDLQRQSLQHKPRRLPLTLLLLLHLLLTALLAVALGQPLLQALRGSATHTLLVLDTSTSMTATDEQPDRLSAAKAEARRIIGALRRGDSIALVELSGQPRIVAQGSGSDATLLLARLNQLQAGGPDGDVTSTLSLAQATIKANMATRTIVLTDRALRAPEAATVVGSLEWRSFGGLGDNVAIVAFAARPLRNGRQQLYARVANLGTTPIARTLQLDLDGTRAATEPMRLAPGAEAEWSWPIPGGTKRAEALLTGSDLQPTDDRAAVVLGNTAQTRAVLVTSADTPIERALRAQRGFAVEQVSPVDYQPNVTADLVVFHSYVPAQLPAAPVLLVAPPSDQALFEVTDAAFEQRPAVAADERFAGIDWKPVTFDRIARITPPEWASVAVASGDTPIVLTGQFNDHPIAIWAFDPAASNIPHRLAFPLLTAATTRHLLRQPTDQLRVGGMAPFALRDPQGNAVAQGERLSRAGIYRLQSGESFLAVNALDAEESNLQQRTEPAITEVPQNVLEDDTPVGRELWQPLVIAALAVLLAEWLYSHRGSFQQRGARKQRAQV